MATSHERKWRETCPKLNEFVLKLHQRFTDSTNSAWLIKQLHDAKDQALAAKKLQDTLTKERRKHLERIVQVARLRDESKPMEGHVWHMVSRLSAEKEQRILGDYERFGITTGTNSAEALWGWWPKRISERDIT